MVKKMTDKQFDKFIIKLNSIIVVLFLIAFLLLVGN